MAATTYPTISSNQNVQAAYERMRRRGESHSIAEMLATRTSPGGVTDDSFMRELSRNNQFARIPQVRENCIKRLREAGGSPVGKEYVPGLARFPNDPEAWVSSKSEMVKKIESRGWTCDGDVKVKRAEGCHDPGPPIAVADDILEERVKQVAAVDPGKVATPTKRRELKEQIKETIKPHWATD